MTITAKERRGNAEECVEREEYDATGRKREGVENGSIEEKRKEEQGDGKKYECNEEEYEEK